MNKEFSHQPVLVGQVINQLNLNDKKKLIIDATLGLGGHSKQILENCPKCSLIGIDQDDQALISSAKRLGKYKDRIRIIKGNFSNINQLIDERVDGILFDLGLSSMQIDDSSRGFSFNKEAELDMRMDKSSKLTAQQVINNYSVNKLTAIIRKYGEEKWAKKIAINIDRVRKREQIETTVQLAEIIRNSIPRKYWPKNIDPTTKTFQAIRIEVNDELNNLKKGLDQGFKLLKKGGRVVVISFHSLEDRIVKNKFKDWVKECVCPPDYPICKCEKEKQIKILTKKPIRADKKEVELNPRASSAKLRACEKI